MGYKSLNQTMISTIITTSLAQVLVACIFLKTSINIGSLRQFLSSLNYQCEISVISDYGSQDELQWCVNKRSNLKYFEQILEVMIVSG